MNDIISQVYGGQKGADLPFFIGKQYGSGWLRTVARFAFPFVKRAVKVATNTAEDVLADNKPFGESLRDNALGEAQKYFSGINSAKKRKRISVKGTIFAKKQRK